MSKLDNVKVGDIVKIIWNLWSSPYGEKVIRIEDDHIVTEPMPGNENTWLKSTGVHKEYYDLGLETCRETSPYPRAEPQR